MMLCQDLRQSRHCRPRHCAMTKLLCLDESIDKVMAQGQGSEVMAHGHDTRSPHKVMAQRPRHKVMAHATRLRRVQRRNHPKLI